MVRPLSQGEELCSGQHGPKKTLTIQEFGKYDTFVPEVKLGSDTSTVILFSGVSFQECSGFSVQRRRWPQPPSLIKKETEYEKG
ncbi:MAG: hypothetical protein ACQEUB_10125, partial [Thermodesulfobacteriota bacterium]